MGLRLPRQWPSLMIAGFLFLTNPFATDAAPPQPVTTVEQAHRLLHKGTLNRDNAQALADYFTKHYQGKDLKRGTQRHMIQRTPDGGGYVAWCLQAPKDADVVLVAEKGRKWPMVRLGDRDLWVWAEKFGNFTSVHYRYEVNGKRMGGGSDNRFGFESYPTPPDGKEQKGVPKGKLIPMGKHVGVKHYPGAERNWWVYVPAQYADLKTPAKLIVFNDGGGFIKGDGNACTVLDNLIHKKKIPVMIAVFVDPGTYPAKNGEGQPRSNRGNEYDTCTPKYATFLEEEILPIVKKTYKISDNPRDRAMCGSSSGASCAFTAAWHRNDLYRRVISFVGSFCDFRPLEAYPSPGAKPSNDPFGPWKTGHDYPALIRKTNPPKDIKVFLQDGDNDLDNQLGNWYQSNLQMESALAYSGYDHRFVAGKGMHSKNHGMSLLPEILIWLWTDAPKKERSSQ